VADEALADHRPDYDLGLRKHQRNLRFDRLSRRYPAAARACLAYTDVVLDRPLLILPDDQRELPDDDWRAAERWLDVIESEAPAPLGVVLPLELPGPWGRRGELWGIELLRWLRWSGSDSVRLLPVLAVAWQPLEMILRCKHELLLISPGTRFVRLPDVMDGPPSIIDRFAQHVRAEPLKWGASKEDIDQLAGGSVGEAARLTHHDLANEGYSACRLWAGYVRALRDAGGARPGRELTQKIAWAQGLRFPWQDELERRQRQPAFQQFQIARRALPPPQYAPIQEAERIVQEHAICGLPPALRLLLVDDEFDKGLADALLRILFGDAEFTAPGPERSEWVYAEASGEGQNNRWVRLACVKNTTAAIHWLKHWRELDAFGDVELSTTHDIWLDAWASPGLGVNQLERIDYHTAPPAKPITVILLDLRLSREQPEAAYDPHDFDSLVFRRAVKDQRPDLPVIILTASRQALNYAVAMADAGSQDGWLTKEAPDVPIDDANSSRAVHYLLERLHLFSLAGEWYRPELGWSSPQMTEFNRLWQRPDRESLLGDVRQKAGEVFQAARGGRGPKVAYGVRFLGFIQSIMPAPTCRVMQLLVARKVFLACLLDTADWSAGEPSWNVDEFKRMLPQGEGRWRNKEARGIYDVVVYTRDLWFPGRDSPFNRLLPEEYDWLLAQDWKGHAAECSAYLDQCRQRASATS
jgi:CheY-like chemotaxis protein